jgi:hypothetical protein
MSFDDDRREDERRRLEAAAQRSKGRSGATPDHSLAGDRFSSLVLHLALGGGVAAAGGVLVALGAIFSLLLVLLFGLVLGVAGVAVVARGVLRQLGGSSAVAPPASSRDGRARAAWDAAREAIEGAPALEEGQKLELVAALEGGYRELNRMEEQRPKLMAALRNLPADGGGEAGDRLHGAIDGLDARRDEFIGHCGRLQATVATMALTGDRTSAMAELSRVTSGLGHRVEADSEIEQMVAAARLKQGQGQS